MVLLLTVSSLARADGHELLNQEERQWLDSLDAPLLIGAEPNYHPYSFVDDQGALTGVAGDYMLLLQKKLGFDFEVRLYPTFTEVLAAAENRRVDVIPLLIDAPERRGYLDFSQPIYDIRNSIFTRKETLVTLNVDNIGRMRVGMVEGYALTVDLAANHPEIEIVLVSTELEGLLALSLGTIDAYISEIGVATYYIQREAITNLRVAGDIGETMSQTFGTRNDWPILNSIIGKGLASITEEEHEEIRSRWIKLGGADTRAIDLLWKKVGAIAGLISLLLIAMFAWTLSLRRLVAKRTVELQQELAERRLLEADKLRLAIAVEQSAEYVLVVDTSANIEFANLSFKQAYGAADIRGRSFESLVSGDSSVLTDALQSARDEGHWRGQVILTPKKDGALKVNMAIAPIFNNRTVIDGYVATGRDVTKEALRELRLRQGEKLSALGTLASGIAHDFNNLLVPILGYTEMARFHHPDQVATYLDQIEDASGHARDLIQRIVAFGRGGSDEFLPLDLRYEIEDAVSFLRSLLPKTIELTDELTDCGTLLGDRTQIQQVLVNLCGNASDAMAQNGGTLTITLEPITVHDKNDAPLSEMPAGKYGSLTFSDTGVGMSEETRVKIFDPYFTDKQQASGTGLGLAIVHNIVTRHGGFIHVDSEKRIGTTFQIYLPTVAIKTSKNEEPNDVEIPRGSGQRIMLIDDDDSVRTTLETMLKRLGYEVSEWSNPASAISALSAEPDSFDGILADFTMPGLTGVQVALQALAIRPDIPVVVMTGNPGAMQDYDGRWIGKPMRLRELADCLHELLSG